MDIVSIPKKGLFIFFLVSGEGEMATKRPHPTTEISRKKQKQETVELPVELWRLIFIQLDWDEWCALRVCCHLFRNVIDWHILSEEKEIEHLILYKLQHSPTNVVFSWSHWEPIYGWKQQRQLGRSALQSAIERANLSSCIWLHNTFHFTAYEVRRNDNHLLLLAVTKGLPLCLWLHDTFHFTARDARSCNNEAIHNAAVYGDLPVCIWLYETFGLTADDVREWGTLSQAVQRGHLSVCQWLIRTFQLTAADVSSYDLYCAAENGHLPVCKWLQETFPFTAADLRKHGSIVLAAAQCNHLQLCQWLWSTFQFTKQDVQCEELERVLVKNAERGHLEMCQWLVQAGELTREDALYLAVKALHAAVMHSQFQTAEWFWRIFTIHHNNIFIPTLWFHSSDERLLWLIEHGLYPSVATSPHP